MASVTYRGPYLLMLHVKPLEETAMDERGGQETNCRTTDSPPQKGAEDDMLTILNMYNINI
ncbi:MAG: hypothetical protein LBQ89_05670 [Treponema sp.]|nr:hypothetical protein [Treponema sp.]